MKLDIRTYTVHFEVSPPAFAALLASRRQEEKHTEFEIFDGGRARGSKRNWIYIITDVCSQNSIYFD